MSENSAMHREAFWLLAGQRMNWGMSREVYDSPVLPDCVVKVEDSVAHFQNVIEWETWQRVKSTPHSRWFAECKWISPSGAVLVMQRTRPPAPEDFPVRMPAYLCDFKKVNYGMLGNFLVCHDYGINLLMEKGMTKRMQRATWLDTP